MTDRTYDGECATCDHAVVRTGHDYQCDEGCRCTMRGCVLYVGHPLQVAARAERNRKSLEHIVVQRDIVPHTR